MDALVCHALLADSSACLFLIFRKFLEGASGFVRGSLHTFAAALDTGMDCCIYQTKSRATWVRIYNIHMTTH